MRAATIGALGAGIMAAAHVDSPLGPYLVWTLAGTPTAMLSWTKAILFTASQAVVLIVAVVLARVLAQSPVLMLATLGLFGLLTTDLIDRLRLGTIGLVTQVLVLDTFYGVMFTPAGVGWSAAYTFGGLAIAIGLIALTDNWLWPDPAEAIFQEALANWMRRLGQSLKITLHSYLSSEPITKRPLKLHRDSLGLYLELLSRAQAEGLSPSQRGVLGAALTRAARLQTRVEQFVLAIRTSADTGLRRLIAEPLEPAVGAITEALDELAGSSALMLRTGPDDPPSPAAARMKSAISSYEADASRMLTPYLDQLDASERANFGDLLSTIRGIGRLLERPLDKSVTAPTHTATLATPRANADTAHWRYCLKVAIAMVAGYTVGLTSHRPDLSTIMTTIIITALPTYGAAARKMILRLVGTVIGGLFIILSTIIVSPNFETLLIYITAIFLVLLISSYSGQGSQRIAYAGKQIGTTFVLAFAGLSPSLAVEAPLWRVWGVLLGTSVVLIVLVTLWPAYCGDALPARLRRLIELALASAPGATVDSVERNHLEAELSGVLEEILAVADDARFEGGASKLDPDAVVQSAGTLRRIAHRFEALGQLARTQRSLDPALENEKQAVISALLANLRHWLAVADNQQARTAAQAAPRTLTRLAENALVTFTQQVELDNFAALEKWAVEERRIFFAQLESLRRLVFLSGELDEFAVRIWR